MAEPLKNKPQNKPMEDTPVFHMIEQAFFLAKKLPAEIFFPYYLGTMPFILGLLYFFNDMAKNAFAHEYCLAASLGLALLFAWMKTWQAIFCIKTYNFLGQYQHQPYSVRSIVRLTITQTVIHTSALIVLPVALIVTIPFAWTLAMYQIALIQNNPGKTSIKARLKESFLTAKNYTFLNHIAISVLSLFGFFIFLNISIAIYAMPFLIKSLFGVESSFTLGGFNIFNTTFLLSSACITHLLFDPLIKIFYVIQKYNFQSQKTGDDLLADLASIKESKKKSILIPLVLFFCFLGTDISHADNSLKHKYSSDQPANAYMQQTKQAGIQKEAVDASKLEASIDHVMGQREYSWRLPREEYKTDDKQGFFETALKWVASKIKTLVNRIMEWIANIFDWLKKFFVKDNKPAKPDTPKTKLKPGYLAICLIVILAILLFAIFRHIKRFKPETKPQIQNNEKNSLDLNDENILADRLSHDKWLSLAKELMEKGELRLAIRALYLSCLAQLAGKRLVNIASHKSNQDYQIELAQRGHGKKNMLDDFTFIVSTVERIWYGMHEVNQNIYDEVLSTRKRMMQIAGE